MLNGFIKKLIGSKNDRELKRLWARVQIINAFESEISKLSDSELKEKTTYFKNLLANQATLEDILPEAFAVVREASKRVLRMRHFDVQLIGGMVLHGGAVAEMRTGEGKTLTATLPLYLNGLTGRGSHLVTVNDYLASRDAKWMGRLYNWLGLSVGVVQHGLTDDERRKAYSCDITYATNNEIGFDYLRDNMKWALEDCTQRDFVFAIVDEVDSILIDEARTPLIIAGSSEDDTSKYFRISRVVPSLVQDKDFVLDEKDRQITLTDEGVRHAERLLGITNLYDPSSIETLHGINQSLLAHNLYRRDVDYMVRDKEDRSGLEVVIVDEFTGRIMPGRRWSNGLHQAIEAKEGVEVNAENQTLATVTFQNFFRMYEKLSGMTGTAETEARELLQTYNIEVVVIPTNMPMIRTDFADSVYATKAGKKRAIVEEIKKLHSAGQPVLVGTASIESSEELSEAIKVANITHVVLNAKHHAKEAEIIAQAGRKGAVTIATNMAGRGTDIVLGGNPEGLAQIEAENRGIVLYGEDGKETAEFIELVTTTTNQTAMERQEVIRLGGLHILGTERNESRRIDNQLRGRAGRQGDPGTSRFYLSLEDDLMRIFGGDRIKSLMSTMGMVDDEPIEAGIVTRAIERSQRRVESHNFEIRRHLLEYDDVMNKQRIFFYGLRREILKGNTKKYVLRIAAEIVEGLVNEYLSASTSRDIYGFVDRIEQLFAVRIEPEAISALSCKDVENFITKKVQETYKNKEKRLNNKDIMRWHERVAILQIIDHAWKCHLLVMDHLKEAIGFRGYSQKDPLVEYKRESYDYFEQMRFGYEDEVISYLYRVEPQDDSVINGNSSSRDSIDEYEVRLSGKEFSLDEDKSSNTVKRVMRFSAGGIEKE
jgi:preprotein translocase subunit SecA